MQTLWMGIIDKLTDAELLVMQMQENASSASS